VLCYPNNPAGSSLSAEQAAELALYLNAKLEDARAQGDDGFSVVLDEVYLGITSAKHDPRSSILFHAPPLLLESIFLVLSASKGGWLLLYREWHVVAGGMRLTLMCVAGLGAMPGARAGVLLSPNASLIESVIKLQTACSANASIISQRGLKASLEYLMSEPQALLDVARYMRPRALEAPCWTLWLTPQRAATTTNEWLASPRASTRSVRASSTMLSSPRHHKRPST